MIGDTHQKRQPGRRRPVEPQPPAGGDGDTRSGDARLESDGLPETHDHRIAQRERLGGTLAVQTVGPQQQESAQDQHDRDQPDLVVERSMLRAKSTPVMAAGTAEATSNQAMRPST